MQFQMKATVLNVAEREWEFNGKTGITVQVTIMDDNGDPYKIPYKGELTVEALKDMKMSERAVGLNVDLFDGNWKVSIDELI